MGYKNIISTATRWCVGLFVMGLMALTTPGASAQVVVNGNVFGGGNAATVSGNTTVLMDGTNATVRQDLYGGGAQAAVGTLNGSNKATTAATVTVLAGTVERDVYGGGLGTQSNPATVNSTVQVSIGKNDNGTISGNATILGNIFGCNNVNGSPQDTVRVDIWRTAHTTTPVDNSVPSYDDIDAMNTAIATREAGSYADACKYFALQGVYGGGNQADYVPATATGVEVYIHNCENTVKMVYGGGRAAAVGSSSGQHANATVIIDGGLIDTLFAGGDGHTTSDGLPKNANNTYLAANIFGNASAAIHGGYYTAAFAGSNTSGTISGTKTLTIDKSGPCGNTQEELIGSLFGGGNLADVTGDVTLTVACGAGDFNEIYGGCNLADIGTQTLFDGGTPSNVTLNLWGGTVTNVYGGSKGVAAGDSKYPAGKAANIYGNVTLNLYGGTVTNAFGGSNINGNIAGKITVNVLDAESATCPLVVENVYGSGNLTAYTPSSASLVSPEVNIIHIKSSSSITGDVFGGGLGQSATVTANPKVTIGAAVPATLPTGYTAPNSNFPYATVSGNVYGGGSQASVSGNTAVYVSSANSTVSGSVFGGGSQAGVTKSTEVNMSAGTVTTALYGGCNASGTVGNGTTVNMTGGTTGYLYGGGYGENTLVNKGSASQGTSVILNGNAATVSHDVYGGGNAGTVTGGTQVDIKAGTVTADVYGGGYSAPVTGATLVNIGSSTDDDDNDVVIGGYVFGANNVSGTPTGISEVHVYSIKDPTSGTYALAGVYGGGNKADYTGTKTLVEVHNCFNEIENVFGGGNAASATTTDVTIHGGTIDNVFGGGDGHLLTYPNLAWNATNNPYLAAPITGNTKVLIEGGQINNVFGGNNTSGNIAGTIDVTVEWDNGCSGNTLGYVYGGGKDASYTPSSASAASPQVKIYNGTVTHDVYGGGKGAGATVTAVPTVTVGDLTSGHDSYAAIVNGAVYGGGQLAPVVGSTSITIQKSNTQVDGVFGGGSEAGVSINTNISMTGGTVNGGTIDASAVRCGIYGGCNTTGTVGGNAIISVTGGTIGTSKSVYANIHGGGYGQPTLVNGNVEITLGTNSAGPSLYGNVYGGSALGNVNASTDNHTYVTLTKGTIDGNLFGGGLGDNTNAALVKGNVTVSVAGGSVTGGVFGCNDQNGTPQGSVVVNITGSNNTANAIANVYGGGNEAHYHPTTANNGYPQVTVSGCSTNVGNVYGGGNAAAVPQTSVTINGGIIANVFGGGNGESSPAHVGYENKTANSTADSYGNGTVTVAIHAGQIGNVYGGNNAGGTVRDKVTVTADWSGSAACKSLGYVYGGGYGADTRTNGDVEVNISGATVTHDVYGGSALGQVNNEATDKTTVNILSGTVSGNVYGGGLGLANVLDGSGNITTDNSAKGQVNGEVTVNIGSISGSTLSGSATIGGMVFGGNNTNGSPQADVYVNVYKTAHNSTNGFPANPEAQALPNDELTSEDVVALGHADNTFAISAVYGGGNQAAYAPAGDNATHVTVFGCDNNTIKYVYGGGRAADSRETVVTINGGRIYQVYAGGNGSSAEVPNNPGANITHDATLTVRGGLIDGVFGGSNTLGEINGTATVTYEENDDCDMIVITTFGGGNQAPGSGNIVVTIPCGTKGLTDVYGCSNQADFTGNVTLNILGGTMKRAFGGSKEADIKGNVTVNVFAGDIDEVFGGNNAGGYIFGDNLTEGNITVNVDLNNNQCPGEKKIDFVYGGGNNAPYKPDGLTATTTDGVHTIDVSTATNPGTRISPVVNIISGYQEVGHQTASDPWYTVDMAVFGGGKGAPAVVKSNPKVVIGADRVQQLDGNLDVVPVSPAVQNLPVRIGTHEGVDGSLQGNVFGGGNAAAVEGSTKVVVKGSNTRVYNNVYGGGNAATVTGNTDVQIGAEN